MTSRITIAVDAMSGDHGVAACVPGALATLQAASDFDLVLVGDPDILATELERLPAAMRTRVRIQRAAQVVSMSEHPREAIRRKKDSSMRRALDLVAAGEATACVSAGNTGALMAMAHFVLGMIPGVERPAIISALPSRHGHTHVLDLGANASCTADHLVQFAVMGAVVAADVDGLERPRIGLLNIGEEEIKGGDIVREAGQRLARSRLNYIGFVEGDDIFSGEVDVVVTDGFTGNVALKTAEGLARLVGSALREEFSRNPLRRLMGLTALPALGAMKQRLDPRRYNGASMVGLNGIVIKSHGSADPLAFGNAVRTALVEAHKGVPSQISSQLELQAA